MFDRYDPRSDDGRNRGDSWDRSFGSRGSAGERDRDDHPRDVFTRDLDLPRGRDREHVRDRERVYEIDGAESRALATIGAFRVVAESDLHDIRNDSQSSRRSLKHLENEGLIRTSPLSSEDRAVTLTDRGRDLLEANRYERDDREYWTYLREEQRRQPGCPARELGDGTRFQGTSSPGYKSLS